MARAGAGAGAAERSLEDFARRLGYGFKKPGLLREALTHPSAVSGRNARDESYQRLEFLGDRVLALIVAELLLRHFPREPEGDLARRLSALVRRETLAEVAASLDLGHYLILAKSEAEAGESANPTLLADACEAVIGAVFLDGGLGAAKALVEPLWTPLLEAERSPPQDAKTALQEWAQGRGLPLPDYREVGREGPSHELCFTVEVAVQGMAPSQGQGRSKRQAEQAAAQVLLTRLATAGS